MGRLTNPPEEVDLETIAREAVELVMGQIAERGRPGGYSAGIATIRGDRPRLLEVFQNLVDNATKFMGDQPAPRIEIGPREQEGETVIVVRDNGIGIKPNISIKSSVSLTSSNRDERHRDRLALVKRVVETHGGRIWVESDGLGSGAAFCFTIKGSKD